MSSVLSFEGYVIKKMDFCLNTAFKPQNKEDVAIHPKFERNILKVSNDKAIVRLVVKIEENANAPFSLYVEMEGLFGLKKWEAPENVLFVKNNATAILFPYLRSAVSTLTCTSNIGPYLLPVVNVMEMFKDE